MLVGDDDSGELSAESIQVIRNLMEVTAGAEGEDDALAGKAKLAQLLFAQMASANIDPPALRMLLQSDRHPLFVRRFVAMDLNGHRQSWTRQEERVLKRYANAQQRLLEAKAFQKAAESKLAAARSEVENVSVDVALMRLSVMLRGLQEFVQPAVQAGPLVTLMLAVLGDPASDSAMSADDRAAAKRTLDVLTRRIADQVFLEGLGKVVRDFVTSYDDEVGAARRLSIGEAEKEREALFNDDGALAKLASVASGVVVEASREEAPEEYDPFKDSPI